MQDDAPNVADTHVNPNEEQQEENKPLLSRNLSLHQQASKLTALLDNEEVENKEDDKKPPVDDKTPPADADEEEFIPADDDDEEEVEQKPTELQPWQEYIMQRLPEIQVIGKEGEEGKEKLYKVKRAEELPRNFIFKDSDERSDFKDAVREQETKAQNLLKEWQKIDNDNKAIAFQRNQAIEIQKDIKALQKEKVLPEFKYKDNDARFASDPAVIEANEILDLMNATNAEHYKRSQETGRSMYRISYREAADKYYAAKWREERNKPPVDDKKDDKPTSKADKQEEAKKKNDGERKQTAAKVSSDKGAPADVQKNYIRRGTRPQDIYRAFKAGRI